MASEFEIQNEINLDTSLSRMAERGQREQAENIARLRIEARVKQAERRAAGAEAEAQKVKAHAEKAEANLREQLLRGWVGAGGREDEFNFAAAKAEYLAVLARRAAAAVGATDPRRINF